MRAVRSLTLGAGLTLAIVISNTAPAGAQQTDNKLLAEQLFAQGRDLAKAEKWAEACPKFEASLRYDPTLGTRLNLATCYEKIGRIASAWGHFRDAAELARAANDTARRDYALKHAAALQPRLPRLTIIAPKTPPAGFAVTRDGVPIDLAALGTELYVDPGPHEVTATAPGFEPFTAKVSVEEAKSGSVEIPDLEPAKTPPPPPPGTQPGGEVSGDIVIRTEPDRTRRLIGLGVTGGGVVLTGVGLFFGARAMSTNSDAEELCPGTVCNNEADGQRGRELVDRARSQATISTVLVATGIAAAAAGVVVWVTAPRRELRERRETAVVPLVSGRDLGLAVMGRF